MRIAFVTVSSQAGGSETVLLDLLRWIPEFRPGWSCHVVAPSEGPLTARARELGAAIHVVPMPTALARLGEQGEGVAAVRVLPRLASALVRLPSYERELGRVLGGIAPHVVHSNGLKAHIAAARTAVRSRRLWHLHDYVSPRPMTRRLLRRYSSRCDAWVANSDSVAFDARRVIRPRSGRTEVVVHNGVDLVKFGTARPAIDLDARAGLPPAAPGTLRVGLVATFARWKGQEIFLRALANVPRDIPLRGYIIGGPVYETSGSQYSLEELQGMARALGCADRVGFTGFQSDMPSVMQALDIVVHASTEPEPFGLVLIEAMAAGRPLITSALGGASEIVTAGETALVHQAGDTSALESALLQLAQNPELRQRLADAGRRRAEAYDVRLFAQRFCDVYDRTLQA